jgi:hypothetical protein
MLKLGNEAPSTGDGTHAAGIQHGFAPAATTVGLLAAGGGRPRRQCVDILPLLTMVVLFAGGLLMLLLPAGRSVLLEMIFWLAHARLSGGTVFTLSFALVVVMGVPSVSGALHCSWCSLHVHLPPPRGITQADTRVPAWYGGDPR